MTRLGFLTLALGLAWLVPAASLRADDKKTDDKKADDTKAVATVSATGTYTWTMKRQDQEITSTLKLKQDGKKLTGTINGFQGNEIEIQDGKVEGDEVSFTVIREFNDNKITIKYKGKLESDAIKGKASVERDGQTNERDWEAKRSKDKA